MEHRYLDLKKSLFASVAVLSTGLGVIGLFLPLLPTTPFLILAFWAAAKGSPRFQFWLYRHPRFGPPLRAWYRYRALSVRTKVMATLILCSSLAVMGWSGVPRGGLLAAALFFLAIGVFLWTRNTLDTTRSR